MAFPQCLPRSETFYKIPPWASDAEPVDNGFHDGVIIGKRPADFPVVEGRCGAMISHVVSGISRKFSRLLIPKILSHLLSTN